MADDILLTANLDHSKVSRALDQIEKRVDAMVQHSDQRMKQMGEATHEVAVRAKRLYELYGQLAESQMTPKQRKEFDELRKGILQTANALDGMIDGLREVENIKIDTDFGELKLPRNVLRDAIEKDIGQIRGDLLNKRLEQIILNAEPNVKAAAQKIQADLQAVLNDPTLTGEKLQAEIKGIEERFKRLDAEIRKAREYNVKVKIDEFELERGQIKEVIDREFASIRANILQERIERVMEGSTGAVRSAATVMKDDLERAMKDMTLSGKDLEAELNRIEKELGDVAQRARDVQKIDGTPRVVERESRQRGVVLQDAQDLADRLIRVMNVAEGEVANKAASIRKDLIQMTKDPEIQSQQLRTELNRLEAELDELIDQSVKATKLNITGGAEGVGGRRDVLADARQRLLADEDANALRSQLTRIMTSAREDVSAQAKGMRADLENIFTQPIEGDALRQAVARLKADADALENIKPPDIISQEEITQADLMKTKLTELDQIAAQVAQSGTAEAQERVAAQQAVAQAAAESAREQIDAGANAADAYGTANKQIQSAISISKQHARVLKSTADEADEVADSIDGINERAKALEPIDARLIKQEALKQFNDNMKNTQALMKSSNADAKSIATELNKLGKEAKDAFDKGETNAKEFRDEMSKIDGQVKRTANAFGEDLPAGAERSRVSLWKLGNVADRVGFRGAGGATQLIDALRGIPIAAVAGVVALAAVAAAVVKITQAVIEMGKRAAQAFLEFTKGALDTAKSVEVTERQLGGFLRAPDLGEGYRKLLQGLSYDVGLDLTKDFARVIVPLANDLDEVEQAAEIAGTLAHAFQETEESIANAIKQAAGGHFRPLIERFGLTEFEIQKIKNYQNATDEFTGVLLGLQDALDFRGLSIENLSGTLQFLQGQFQVLRQQVETTFGTPVKEALSEQFTKLFDIVEERKESITSFFESLGETVGGVVTAIGDALTGFADDISDEDITDFQTAIETLGEKIEEVIGRLADIFSSEDRSLVDVAVDLTDALTEVATKLDEILVLIRGIKDIGKIEIPGFGDIGYKPSPLPFNLGPIPSIISLAAQGSLVAEGEDANLERIDELLLRIGSRVPVLGPLVQIYQAMGGEILDLTGAQEGLNDAQDDGVESSNELTAAQERQIAKQQALAAQLRDLEQLQLNAAEAQKKITEEEEKLARARTMAEEQIRTRFARQEIDLDIQRSQQREDLLAKHIQRMLQMTDDFNFKNQQAIIDYDQKEADIHTKYSDKLTDIDQDAAEKKIDIERKFRERLEDIRAKFDLDAEEAIRRNDAVALLRIRRRMQLEIDQAKKDRKRQEQEAEDSAEKRRDEAKVWLDRQIRDNDEAERRKLEDIKAADEQQRKQTIDQYLFEYNQIQKNYDRQRAKIDENEKRALDDMEKNFAAREEDLSDSLENEYNIVKEWKDAETNYMKLKLQEQAALLRAQRELWYREGSLFRYMIGGQSLYGEDDTSGYTPRGIGGRIDRGGGKRGRDVTIGPGGVSGYRQHGGFVTSGNLYGINERGAEPFYATRAGIIASRDALLMSPFTGSGLSNVDNSRHMNAEIYTNDPTQMSPIQRTLMKAIVTEELLAHGM